MKNEQYLRYFDLHSKREIDCVVYLILVLEKKILHHVVVMKSSWVMVNDFVVDFLRQWMPIQHDLHFHIGPNWGRASGFVYFVLQYLEMEFEHFLHHLVRSLVRVFGCVLLHSQLFFPRLLPMERVNDFFDLDDC